jgi:hypothetical protein
MYHTNNIYAKSKCAASPSSDLASLGHLPPGEGRAERPEAPQLDYNNI